MSIWFKELDLVKLNASGKGTSLEYLDIQVTEYTENSLIGTIPVDHRTIQPFKILHGGMNCVLAESLGSLAANLVLDQSKFHAVGLSITTNHIKSVRNGLVSGIAKPVHIGRTTQVWTIETFNSAKKLTSTTSLTMAVIKKLEG